MKNSITKFDLENAFKALDDIEIPTPTRGRVNASKTRLKECFIPKPNIECLLEDYYDIDNKEEIASAAAQREDEIAKAKLARIEQIVDLDAESPDELLGSYSGKYIIQCPQCMIKYFKNPEDVVESENDPKIVNVEETCQNCGNTSGYNLIGKVAPVADEDMQNFADETDLDMDETEMEEEVPEEETTGEDELVGEEELEDNDLDLDLDLDQEETEEDEEEKNESFLSGTGASILQESELKEEDNQLPTPNQANFMKMLQSDEFQKDIDDEEVKEILADSLQECGIDKLGEYEDLDDETVEECINKSLKEVYENVDSYKLTDCTLEEGLFIVEGNIKFKSGAQKRIKYAFSEARANNNKGLVEITGLNENLADNGKFTLQLKAEGNKLFAECLSYSYKIENNLIEGVCPSSK